MEPLILQFAKHGRQGLVDEVKISKAIVRYLHYFGDQQAGAEIAAPHIKEDLLFIFMKATKDCNTIALKHTHGRPCLSMTHRL